MSQTEKNQAGDLILSEPPMEYCREAKTVTLADAASITVGQMLETGGATADYDVIDADADAVAVCIENYTNNTGAAEDKKLAVLVRGGPLILNYDILNGEITTKATAVAALIAAMGNTITRTEVGS